MVTFGNIEFTKMAMTSIYETVTSPYHIVVVVGKPGDEETIAYLKEEGITGIVHDRNYGFPASLNDIYDFAWKKNDFRNLIILGNDVIAYPYAIDSLIHVADTTDNSWICAREFSAKGLFAKYPEAQKYFDTANHYEFTDFDARPWELGLDEISPEITTNGAGLSDVHNLALFKREVFDTVGYIDVNFYPAYFEDNDYVRRAINLGLTNSCKVKNAIYFHFWSRTIHQGSGGSTDSFFKKNRDFYKKKWGGEAGHEQYELPFNGRQNRLNQDVTLQPDLNISSREQENAILNYWMTR